MANKMFSKDLYAILGVKEDATEKEIIKGYRKRALKCHPDKNPDNPKAAELFHELSNALEILSDAAARAAYDQSLKAKRAVVERNKVLDSKRKKFKEDLEAREQAFFEQTQKQKEVASEEKLAAEIARLRKDGSRLLEQEQERLREELKKQAAENKPAQARDDDDSNVDTPRVKLKWKAAKDDADNGGYTRDYIQNLLNCYGTVSALVMSSKRNGSAIVEFDKTGVSATILDETGRNGNPLSMNWLSGKPEKRIETSNGTTIDFEKAPRSDHNLSTNPLFNTSSGTPFGGGVAFGVGAGAQTGGLAGVGAMNGAHEGEKDFESLVLMRMRQAEERKKLIEQMMKEDADG